MDGDLFIYKAHVNTKDKTKTVNNKEKSLLKYNFKNCHFSMTCG